MRDQSGQGRVSGVTLIEVLVASSVMMVIVYFVSQALLGSYKHERILQVKQEGREFRDELRSLITNSGNCGIPEKSTGVLMESAFVQKDPAAEEGHELEVLEVIGSKLKKGDSWGEVKIEKIAVVPYRNPVSPTSARRFVPVDTGDPTTALAYRASIQVNYSGRTGSETEIKYFRAEVPVMLKLSGDRASVATCSALDAFDAIAAMCEALSGSMVGDQCILPKNDDGGGDAMGSSRLSVSNPGKTKTPGL